MTSELVTEMAEAARDNMRSGGSGLARGVARVGALAGAATVWFVMPVLAGAAAAITLAVVIGLLATRTRAARDVTASVLAVVAAALLPFDFTAIVGLGAFGLSVLLCVWELIVVAIELVAD